MNRVEDLVEPGGGRAAQIDRIVQAELAKVRALGEARATATRTQGVVMSSTGNGNVTPGGSPFTEAPPAGHARKVSEVLGEACPGRRSGIVWLMSQSPLHKQFFIADLEWPVANATNSKMMTPVLLQQFRLFYAKGPAGGGQGGHPIGVVFWGFVSDEVEARLAQGTSKLRPQDWKSGDKLWVVEVIAPFGGAEEMVRDLKAKVFPEREVRMLALAAGGGKEVRVV